MKKMFFACVDGMKKEIESKGKQPETPGAVPRVYVIVFLRIFAEKNIFSSYFSETQEEENIAAGTSQSTLYVSKL